jgi:hypothetical protein
MWWEKTPNEDGKTPNEDEKTPNKGADEKDAEHIQIDAEQGQER